MGVDIKQYTLRRRPGASPSLAEVARWPGPAPASIRPLPYRETGRDARTRQIASSLSRLIMLRLHDRMINFTLIASGGRRMAMPPLSAPPEGPRDAGGLDRSSFIGRPAPRPAVGLSHDYAGLCRRLPRRQQPFPYVVRL